MSWSPASNGLDDANGILALLIDPTAPQTLYAAAGAGGTGFDLCGGGGGVI